MFIKPLSEINYNDIYDLINVQKVREGYNLDFKLGYPEPDKAKKDIAIYISSFANTSGGYLIIGVDKNYNIVGIDKKIQGKDIDEWMNQILSSNIEPFAYYHDPKIIDIPNSDKIIVVIHIPESSNKPHIVTEKNNYYIRVNDSSKTANHNQIRDMFEISRNRNNDFNEFLQKRNLSNEESPEFGQNKNSSKLFSLVPEKANFPIPKVLFSMIPKNPNQEKIYLPIKELKSWLEQHSKGYFPHKEFSLFHVVYDSSYLIDGIVLNNISNNNLLSYFEVLNSGFIEAGHSYKLTYPYNNPHDNEKKSVAIYLTQIIGYEMMLIGFAKKFYELAKYHDEVLLQISFINVLNLKLYGFHHHYSDTLRYGYSDISNTQHNNFKLNFTFIPKSISDEEILSIAKIHSEKICRVFGLEKDYCFVNNEISIQKLLEFYR
jgi:hypothetical protein